MSLVDRTVDAMMRVRERLEMERFKLRKRPEWKREAEAARPGREDLYPERDLWNIRNGEYPSHTPEFFYSFTFRCIKCGNEFYPLREDDLLTCHHCETTYLYEDVAPPPEEREYPEVVRAKCWRCGEISDNVGGIDQYFEPWFDCPHCRFSWEQDPW